ncbi:hypothetical protein BDY17DRAFT_327895 [Neohortaea acidophila]|uniref:Uncharacterized protein n=1 Tax=Neohortaea acidophila TaxID=245834 RepID=A0A6A6PGJ7_9PEZI|nr:uncharacterized protein BDY17DRAFT_327895 [Neohortaea acidophila]KAF2479099.1 hypothetical protein BDY17DRAFT_327895 [Neohortaea acidophila]
MASKEEEKVTVGPVGGQETTAPEHPEAENGPSDTVNDSQDAVNESAGGLKRRLTNGSTNHYDREMAILKEELVQEKELRLAYEEKVTSLEEEIEELNTQLQERDEYWRAEYEHQHEQERTDVQRQLNTVTEEARSHRQEAANLQRQLSELKKSVSASTRPSTHVSDTTFREEFGLLQHEIQNWVVQNFRRVKIEVSSEELCSRLEKATDEKLFQRLQPLYKDFDASVKLPTLQATVTCFLMEVFDEPYLFGLHGQVEWADRSKQAAEALLSVLHPAAYNRCRAVTFDALRQSESVKGLAEKSSQEIAERVNTCLVTLTEVEESETRSASLKSIMKRAIDLAHLIRVQQAKYEVVMPSPGARFDSSSMDDVFEESEADEDRKIRFATFPALVKITDQEGISMDSTSIVVKAKVACVNGDT